MAKTPVPAGEPPAPADREPPAPAPEPAVRTYLTTRHSDRYGPGGRFLDLTAEAAAPGLSGAAPDLAVPTAEQLSRRRPAP